MNKLNLGAGRGVRVLGPDAGCELVEDSSGTMQVVTESKNAPVQSVAEVAKSLPKTSMDPFPITLSGVSPEPPVCNRYPFDTLRTSQRVYFVPDPYGQTVKPESGHPDPYAISVQDAPRGGSHIGYVPKKMAEVITNFMNDPNNQDVVVHASISRIKGGYETPEGKKLNYGIDILVVFEEDAKRVV